MQFASSEERRSSESQTARNLRNPDMPHKDKSNEEIEKLREKLQGIRRREGIIGYILRGSDAASIDLNDQSKIIDYAVLSATALEEGISMANAFEIGEIDNAILEGANIKVLLLTVGDRRLSVYMDKNVDHDLLCKDLDLT